MMASFLKEYPFMSVYYYWNVLTVQKRTIMLADAIKIKYNKKKKAEKENNGEKVITVGSVEDLM